jgi:hypothetical protein
MWCSAQRSTTQPVGRSFRRSPVPAKNALHTDNHIIKIGEDQFKEQLRIGFDILVHFDHALLVQDAHVHGLGVQIDAAIVFVLLGECIEATSRNLSGREWTHRAARHRPKSVLAGPKHNASFALFGRP